MPASYRGLVDPSKIRSGVKKAERALAPDVIRIMYVFAEDNQGNDSLYFRILLSDAASNLATLFDKTQRIRAKVLAAINAPELGLETYFNFRTESEQAMLRDPLWERS